MIHSFNAFLQSFGGVAAVGLLAGGIKWVYEKITGNKILAEKTKNDADTRIDHRYEAFAEELREERQANREEIARLRDTITGLQNRVNDMWETIQSLQQDKAASDNLLIICEAEKADIQRAFDAARRDRDKQIAELQQRVATMQAWIEAHSNPATGETTMVHADVTVSHETPNPPAKPGRIRKGVTP
jgi:prefoldin subunit 5